MLHEETQHQISTPNRTSAGKLTPYDLGWFEQSYNGKDFYWHYGQTTQIKKAIQRNKNGNKGFYNKEIVTQAIIDNVKGDHISARALYRLYAELNFNASSKQLPGKIIASIDSLGVNQMISRNLILTRESHVRITGVVGNYSPDGTSWCDYGWIDNSSGEIVWQMQSQPSLPAGGALKNQRVEASITLPAGKYTLKYKSDWGHAYDNWDALPPDGFN